MIRESHYRGVPGTFRGQKKNRPAQDSIAADLSRRLIRPSA